MTGHVTAGGSICTELLTPSGWSPSYTIQSIVISIASDMTTPPGEGRVDFAQAHRVYGMAEARQAFERVGR